MAKKAAEKYPEYGITDEKISVIVAASPLHDIGKIAIKDSVLLKPGRLTKEELSIADVYDALVSDRVYKKAIAKDKAYQMILDGECGTFSPRLIECFKESRQEFEDLAHKYEMKKEEI